MVEPTHLRNMLVKMVSSSPIFGLKINKYLKITTFKQGSPFKWTTTRTSSQEAGVNSTPWNSNEFTSSCFFSFHKFQLVQQHVEFNHSHFPLKVALVYLSTRSTKLGSWGFRRHTSPIEWLGLGKEEKIHHHFNSVAGLCEGLLGGSPQFASG